MCFAKLRLAANPLKELWLERFLPICTHSLLAVIHRPLVDFSHVVQCKMMQVMATSSLAAGRFSAAICATVNPPRRTPAPRNCGLGGRHGDRFSIGGAF